MSGASAPELDVVRFRPAGPDDARAIARLHADSWRRHYRGAYSDSFLDGDVLVERIAFWRGLLGEPDASRFTIVAAADGVVGFANAYLDADPRWGTLLDNLHVVASRQRSGIGSRLLALTAAEVLAHGAHDALYLWVLEQNIEAQAFYSARGGERVERAAVSPPGGIESRINGSPLKLRFAWPDARAAR